MVELPKRVPSKERLQVQSSRNWSRYCWAFLSCSEMRSEITMYGCWHWVFSGLRSSLSLTHFRRWSQKTKTARNSHYKRTDRAWFHDMDFSIPAGLSEEANSRLQELIQDYQDGDVTAKGYCKKRHEILSKYGLESSPLGSPSSNLPRKSVHVRNHSLASTIRSQRSQRSHSQAINDNYSIDTASMPESRRNSIYKVTTRNSSVLNSMASPLGSPAKVLDYGETDSCYNPMIPLLPRNNSPPMTDSLPAILRARSRLYERETAILGINHKNKETGISWDKLYPVSYTHLDVYKRQVYTPSATLRTHLKLFHITMWNIRHHITRNW